MPGAAKTRTDAAAVDGIDRRRGLSSWAGVVAFVLAGLAAAGTRLHLTGHAQGLFLLRPGESEASRSRLELTDDLFLGEGSRMMAGVSFSALRHAFRLVAPHARGEPFLELDWDDADGSGIVRNVLVDGRQVLTAFSRFQDSAGKAPHGLFVGGSLAEVAADSSLQNESGMSVEDERGWKHIWCNVNEAIWGEREGSVVPSSWKFLGSRVLIRDRKKVVIESSHALEIAGVPIYVERYAYFRAGRPWFKLGIRVLNGGDAPVRFSYMYGDEPWVGNFGSGKRNVGWVKEGIVRTDGLIDPRAHRWAGVFDEEEKVANFISWIGDELPSLLYFSNHPGGQGAVEGEPLASNEMFIGLEWRDRVLEPGESASILLSLGVADLDPQTGRPRFPPLAGPR